MIGIFIIEDDPGIASGLKMYLEGCGFAVKCQENFADITEEFDNFQPKLVLIDISLPFKDGFFRCGEIRKISKVPIIFLSSASDNMNIVTAINAGGDDFIAKPFDLAVLTAKINALLRRAYDFTQPSAELSHRGAVLNTEDATLSYNGEKIELTKNEYRILQTLLENKNTVVSREKLMKNLWETDCFVDENTLSVNVARLRRKLDSHGLDNFIATKVGMGYKIGD